MQPQHRVTITCHSCRSIAAESRFTSATFGHRNLLWTGLTLKKFDRCRIFRHSGGPRFARSAGASHPFDLTEPKQQRILTDIMHSRPPEYIHLGMPCGTASRARERPVATSKVLQGAPQPPPLRSADHPLGLPHINPESTSGIRLKKPTNCTDL